MNIPPVITAGDSVTWRDDATRDTLGNNISSGTHTLTYYLRTNAGVGATVSGSVYGSGWQSTLSAATTGAFTAGQWYWQAVATAGSQSITVGSGQLTVKASLAYAGSPSALDNRTQTQKDLDAVDAAIRAIISGGAVSQYAIGNRSLSRYSLSDLQVLRSRLLAEVKREQAASLVAQGLGHPRKLFVRF